MALVAEMLQWLLQHPLAAVGLLIIILFLVIYMSLPSVGPNPFSQEHLRPPQPLVMDQDKRDDVIKQGFQMKHVPDQLDAIVIGSGMGGLATAAMLAKVGRKCLVLEQHDQAGGCLHTYIEKGFEFDVGVHYIGEMSPGEDARILVDQLTDGQLQWDSLYDPFDVVTLGKGKDLKRFPHIVGRERWKKKMLEAFPDEEAALDMWLNYSKELTSATYFVPMVLLKVLPKWLCRIVSRLGVLKFVSNFSKNNQMSLLKGLDDITNNAELKAVLAYNWGDYGTVPRLGAFGIHVSLFNHFIEGAFYPRGGASEFAMHMIPVIEKAGGRVLVRAPVKKILTNEMGTAIGVQVQKTSGEIDIFAPMIITDAGIINTFKDLLPPEVATKSCLYHMIGKRQVRSGVGAFSLFVGLNGSSEELNLKGQNVWSYPHADINTVCEEYFNSTAEEALDKDIPLLFSSFPSAKDTTFELRFPGKSTCVIVTMANYSWFEEWENDRVKKRGDDYESVKDVFAKKMWNQFCEMYPQLSDKVEYFEAGSPISNKYYIAAPKGEIYGLDHNQERFRDTDIITNLRPDSEIPGLYITGQDVLMGGVVGALIGAVICTGVILNRNLETDLHNLKKEMLKSKKSL